MSGKPRVRGRSLLYVQIVFLYGFEAVEGQIVVRLREHSHLPQLRPFTLTAQTRHTSSERQRSSVTVITCRPSADLVVRGGLASSSHASL